MPFSAIDIQTMLDLLTVGNLAAAFVIVAYRRPRDSELPLRLYLLGLLAHAPAWLLLGLRGRAPDWLSVYLGNALIIAGFNLEAFALASIDSGSRRLEILFAALAAAGLAGFCAFAGSPNGRAAAASLAVMLPFLALAAAMLRRRPLSPLRATIGLAAALYSGVHVWRAAYSIRAGSGFGLMAPATVQTIAFLPLVFFLIAGSVGVILFLKQTGDRALAESEDQYRTLVEMAREAIVIVQDGNFAFANRRAGELAGVAAPLLAGRPAVDMIWPEDRDMVAGRYGAMLEGLPAPEAYDFRILGPFGKASWVSASAVRVPWKGKAATLMVLTDIDDRRRAEEEIARLLAEKETLLKEVHHRVKNNLAVAAGLLDVQADEAAGKDPATVLRGARARLGTLAGLYGLLHDTGGFEQVALRPFLESLLAGLRGVFPEASAPRSEIEADEISLDVRRITSLGLLVNEIVTNSMKHAFAGIERPLVSIRARLEGGRVRLRCSDNGRGLPPASVMESDRSHEGSSGFGSQLIALLAKQIGAEIRVSSEGGLAYEIEFDAEEPRP